MSEGRHTVLSMDEMISPKHLSIVLATAATVLLVLRLVIETTALLTGSFLGSLTLIMGLLLALAALLVAWSSSTPSP